VFPGRNPEESVQSCDLHRCCVRVSEREDRQWPLLNPKRAHAVPPHRNPSGEKPADYRFAPQARRVCFTDGWEVSFCTNADAGFMV